MVIPVSIHMIQLNLLAGDMKERELMFLLQQCIHPYKIWLQLRVEAFGHTPMDTWDINNQDYYFFDDEDEEWVTELFVQLHFKDLWGTQHLGNNQMRSAFMEAGYASR